MDWIKGQRGVLKEITAEKPNCYGAVVQIDDLHAVQRVGKDTYSIHRLDRLTRHRCSTTPAPRSSTQAGWAKSLAEALSWALANDRGDFWFLPSESQVLHEFLSDFC